MLRANRFAYIAVACARGGAGARGLEYGVVRYPLSCDWLRVVASCKRVMSVKPIDVGGALARPMQRRARFPPVPPTLRLPHLQLRSGNTAEVSVVPPQRPSARASETLHPTHRHRPLEAPAGPVFSFL